MIYNNDLRFSIKYAVLELKSKGGYSTNYEDVTEGFIVSKCYIVGMEVKFLPNGEAEVIYKVFFPYDDIENFKRMTFMGIPYFEERKQLGINACNDYYPIHIVESIFDTYEEASDVARIENEDLFRKITLLYDWKKKYDELKEKYKKNLVNFSFYEQYIKENTKDMMVTKDERLDVLTRLRRKEN